MEDRGGWMMDSLVVMVYREDLIEVMGETVGGRISDSLFWQKPEGTVSPGHISEAAYALTLIQCTWCAATLQIPPLGKEPIVKAPVSGRASWRGPNGGYQTCRFGSSEPQIGPDLPVMRNWWWFKSSIRETRPSHASDRCPDRVIEDGGTFCRSFSGLLGTYLTTVI